MASDSVAMNALLAKLYRTFTAPDGVTGRPSGLASAFFSFASPGIPITNESLDFLQYTNLGQLNALSNFSQFVNRIPAPSGFWSSGGDIVWNEYKNLVNNAVVNPIQITPQEQQQLDQANAFLYSFVNRVDFTTGAIVRDRVPSQALAAYYVAQNDYFSALLTFNNKEIYVNTHPNDVAAVQDWALNGPLYQNQVRAKANVYDSTRGQVENAFSLIAQITGRGAATYFQDLRNTLSLSARLDGFGSSYYSTLYFPDKFWTSNSWSTFTFGEDEIHTYSQDSSTSWGGGASVSFGLWSFGTDVKYGTSDHFDRCNTSNLKVSVEIIQIPLLRPWMDPSLFLNKSWRLADQNQMASNGVAPPGTIGMLPLYATSMILARNLDVQMNMADTTNTAHRSETQVGGSVGWGPFSLRGNYDQVSTSASHDYTSSDSGIKCSGMQVIGFVCNVVPKSPDPSNAILGHLSHIPPTLLKEESFRVL